MTNPPTSIKEMREAARQIADRYAQPAPGDFAGCCEQAAAEIAREIAFIPIPPSAEPAGIGETRDIIRAHWLENLGCIHDDSPSGGTNMPTCWCGWMGKRVENVAKALDQWADHVAEQLASRVPVASPTSARKEALEEAAKVVDRAAVYTRADKRYLLDELADEIRALKHHEPTP